MPKRVPDGSKRVALNCLVLPETRDYLRSAPGSQGAVVDRAVAALKTQDAQARVMAVTGDPWQVAMLVSPVHVEVTDVKLDSNSLHMKTRLREPRAEGWKRGPRQKGDKTR